MRNDPEVQRAASLYQLGLPRMPASGRSGELLGRGSGTSLEFQEYREYLPGDDVRHLDWAAYARSDTLMIRLYREEISPRMEVILDVTKSMSTSPAKMLVAKQLATLFVLLSGALGGRPNVWLAGDERPPRSLQWETLDSLSNLEFKSTAVLSDLLADHQIPLKRQAVRVVISDFLFPLQPEPLVKRLAGDASVLWMIQVLNAWEADPAPSGGTRLIDVESGQDLDLFLSPTVIADYKRRLVRLQEDLATNCRRAHATFATVIADRGLPIICREDLCRTEILRAG